MKKEIREFVEKAASMNKDKRYIRNYLQKKISDSELVDALNYFDYLTKKEKEKPLKKFFLTSFYFIKLFFIYIIYFFLKLATLFRRKILREETEEPDISTFKDNMNFKQIIKRFIDWYSKKTKKEKIKFLIIIVLISILVFLLIYATFFYYKKCENATCFKDRVANCERAVYESEDFIPLKTKIKGRGIDKCYVDVIFFDKTNNKRLSMTCSLPLGYSFLPYSNLEVCSGPLREFIQDRILLEMQRIIGENILELNPFFKK